MLGTMTRTPGVFVAKMHVYCPQMLKDLLLGPLP